jgi:hypothetical protein
MSPDTPSSRPRLWGCNKGRLLLVILSSGLAFTSCKKEPTVNVHSPITGDFSVVVMPFEHKEEGKFYLSNGRLRIESGSVAIVYIADRKSGWRMLPESKSYMNIGESQVNTYLPQMTNGSPCVTAEQPSKCKMMGREKIQEREATKWELVTQDGKCTAHLWTDDELQVALRWEISNSMGTATYELKNIHNTDVTDDMFQLPSGYTAISERHGTAEGK